jgi:hypothetical protein
VSGVPRSADESLEILYDVLFYQLASIIILNYKNLLKSKNRAKYVGINNNVEKGKVSGTNKKKKK